MTWRVLDRSKYSFKFNGFLFTCNTSQITNRRYVRMIRTYDINERHELNAMSNLLRFRLFIAIFNGFFHNTCGWMANGRYLVRKGWSCLGLVPQQLGTFDELSVDHCEERLVRLCNWVATDSSTERCLLDLEQSWRMQQRFLQGQLDRIARSRDEGEEISSFLPDVENEIANLQLGFDTVFFVEHRPVYTLGTGSDENFILPSHGEPNIPTVRIDRGGEVTYHGPGQLTVYLVLDLRQYRQDLHWYIRALEEVSIRTLQSCGLQSYREEEFTGVWLGTSKVSAVGVKARNWITQHGFSLNVCQESLNGFSNIIPCGIEGRNVTCIADHGPTLSVADLLPHVKAALEQVFAIQLVDGQIDKKWLDPF